MTDSRAISTKCRTRMGTGGSVPSRDMSGEAAAIRKFFASELVPGIDARYNPTQERAIIGESLVGLFIVEALLRDSMLFVHYVAPTTYTVNYDASAKEFRITLGGLTKR